MAHRRIRLHDLDFSDGLSEETLAYTAKLEMEAYPDPLARVKNRGHGGQTVITAANGTGENLDNLRSVIDELHPATISRLGPKPVQLETTLDMVVDSIALRIVYACHDFAEEVEKHTLWTWADGDNAEISIIEWEWGDDAWRAIQQIARREDREVGYVLNKYRHWESPWIRVGAGGEDFSG